MKTKSTLKEKSANNFLIHTLKNKGITLIALIITITILLILAAVSIGELGGNDGLFEKAKEAGNRSNIAQEKENNTLNEYAEAHLIGGQKFTNIDTTETNPAGALPNRVTVIEKDGDKGIVIKDKNNNEWTWVEVPKSIYKNTTYNEGTAPTSSEDYSKIASVMANYASDYRKSGWTDTWYSGCGIADLATYTAMYNKMLKNTYENGGFWIARYEAGIEGTVNTTTNVRYQHTDITIESPKAVSQKEMIPYNYIYCKEGQALASKMAPDSNKTSSLLFGIQWDLTCKYLEEKAIELGNDTNTRKTAVKSNSTNWGNYKDSSLTLTSGKYNTNSSDSTSIWTAYNISTDNYVTVTGEGEMRKGQTDNSQEILLTTGASNQTRMLNISDLAGNLEEWTLEYTGKSEYPCSDRGGTYFNNGSSYPVSSRNYDITSYSKYSKSFRAALY